MINMKPDGSTEINGLKQTLKDLNKLNPAYRRQLTKDFAKVAEPVVTEAKNKVPEMPLSGWKYPWITKSGAQILPWDNSKSARKIRAGISAKKVGQFQGRATNTSTFFIRWNDPAGTVYDMARNGAMGNNLRSKHGIASRALWPAYERNESKVVEGVRDIAFAAALEVDNLTRKTH
jgi:hypothetical protein